MKWGRADEIFVPILGLADGMIHILYQKHSKVAIMRRAFRTLIVCTLQKNTEVALFAKPSLEIYTYSEKTSQPAFTKLGFLLSPRNQSNQIQFGIVAEAVIQPGIDDAAAIINVDQ